MEGKKKPRTAVVVLGDFGRSPRMNYHALSLAEQAGMEVDVVAYSGSQPHERLRSNGSIHMHYISPPGAWIGGLPRPIGLPIKALVQVFQLLWILLVSISRPDFILMQNPPCIPSLLCCQVARALRGARLVIDWHNYAFTLMALGKGGGGIITALAEWYETKFVKADHHLCVTRSMKADLKERMGVDATVLYDCPPEFFRPTDAARAHPLMLRLAKDLAMPLHLNGDRLAGEVILEDDEREATLTTRLTKAGATEWRDDRPAVLVTSTSWTPDEDIGMLIDALTIFDQMAAAAPEGDYPDVLVLITGKGPLRAGFESQLMVSPFRRVSVRCLWLEAEDYPTLLGCADVGISLHTSSSGLDLPMKVVDMFGCGLPVLSAGYQCIRELVRPGMGLLFEESAELATHIAQLLHRWPGDNVDLDKLKDHVRSAPRERWAENWGRSALPYFRSGGGSEDQKSK